MPSTTHPLGIRPAGEGGTTPALAVVINAIVDALADFGVRHIEMPATPERVGDTRDQPIVFTPPPRTEGDHAKHGGGGLGCKVCASVDAAGPLYPPRKRGGILRRSAAGRSLNANTADSPSALSSASSRRSIAGHSSTP